MKKIFIVICVFFPLFLNAQVKGTTTPVTQSVKATQLSDNATLDALAKEIAEKRSEIKALKDSITHMLMCNNKEIDKIRQMSKADIENKKKEIDSTRDSLSSYRKKIGELDKQIETMKPKMESISYLNERIFRQCLLYPMERRYDKKLIDESKECLTELGIRNNPKYKATCDVYWDLLGEYEKYNNELINLLESQEKSFSLKGWKIERLIKDSAIKALSQLTYFRLYEKRNMSPWKSIIYLDDAIDDYVNMINGKKDFNEKTYQALINRLNPNPEPKIK